MISGLSERTRHQGLVTGVLVLVAVAVLLLYTRHNTFPFTYHPDEHTKVAQIVKGKRNFFHPLLLLSTTSTAMTLGHVQKTPMNAAIAGRWTSAVFAVLAISAFSLLAWRWFGWPAALGAAVLLTLNPQVYELAHYFKEDPALLMGLTVAFLALDLFWKSPGPRTAAFCGLGCALAISGKYLGVVILLFILPPLLLKCRTHGWRLAGWFAGGLILPLLLINLPLLRHWSDFDHGLSREVVGVTAGHHGIWRDVPHAFYFVRLRELTPWGVWVGLAAVFGVLVYKFRSLTLPQWLALVFPIFFVVLLSFSPKTSGRYMLPVEAFVAFFAGLVPGVMGRMTSQDTCVVRRRCLAVVAWGILLVAAFTSWSDFREYQLDFTNDVRQELRDWIDKTLPPSAILAEDDRVDLMADPDWKGRPVISKEVVADLGNLDTLRARGVTHVAVSRQTYGRYFDPKLKPGPKEKEKFMRRAAFYRELFKSGKLVWECQPDFVIYLHPGIRVYEIAASSPK